MTSRSLVAVFAAGVGMVLLVGCFPAGSETKADLLRAPAPLKDPAWVPGTGTLLALGDDGRSVVRVDVADVEGSRASARAETFEDLGENLAVYPERPGRAYLPRPESGRISVLDTASLRVVGSYDTGGYPDYVSLDRQSGVLFALSKDRSKVYGVGLEWHAGLPDVRVGGGKGTFIEAPEKGLDPAFWTAGPDGVAFYGGDPPKRLVENPTPATDLAVDLGSMQRAYVAEGEKVVALEGDPQDFLEGELVRLESRGLGGKVEHIASDDLHVYAATEHELVVMRREGLEEVETVKFGDLLKREGLEPSGISGMTVGTEKVYLTLKGEPYVLGVEKP